VHALLHSGRRGARGFGLRAASLRGIPLDSFLEGPGVSPYSLPVSGGVGLPPSSMTLGAALERAERAGALTRRDRDRRDEPRSTPKTAPIEAA